MFNFIKKFFDENKKELKKITPIIKKINSLEPEMQKLTDEQLFNKTEEFKGRLKNGETLDDILPEAFAVVREVSFRNAQIRQYDVQLMAGIFLHRGYIAEMRTGEGKTHMAILAVYLNALEEKGVHVITVNDYLARRDSVWVGQVYARLGLSIGVINADGSYLYDTTYRDEFDEERDEVGSYKVVYEFLKPTSRQEAYAADITYGSNSEFGFDYLRDNIVLDKEKIRQKRGFNYAVIDEADSVMIDEARVPLIISTEMTDFVGMYKVFTDVAKQLKEGTDYTIDEKKRSTALTSDGIKKVEKILNVDNLYTDRGIVFIDHLENALKAKSIYKEGKDYLVYNNEVVMVDQSTGRMKDGMRWSGGLHQALESKEGINIKPESRTYASITYQNFFRLYKKLAGMTGTAETSKEEFYSVYSSDVVVIPTHREIARIDRNDLVFATELGKFKVIAKKIKELNKKGQPVLVGTASVERSELLSNFLKKEKISHTVLNAKNHEHEGEIIADAGKKDSVTIATNMAGRGVDIKLGGAEATKEEYQEVIELGGLFVLGTERHDSRRIDNQLRGRSGRQGDAGETQFYISFDDDLMRVYGNSEFMKNMMTKGIGEEEPLSFGIINKQIEAAQAKIEGNNFDSRKYVLQYDDVLDIQRKAIYKKRRDVLLANNEEFEKKLFSEIAVNDEIREIIENKKEEIRDEKEAIALFRKIYLETIDKLWMDHLNIMDYLKSSSGLKSIGQQNPILEYKKTSKIHFENLNNNIVSGVAEKIKNIKVEVVEDILETKSEMEKLSEKAIISSGVKENKKSKTIKNIEKKIGRNDLCHCGSGLKFKNCHGKK